MENNVTRECTVDSNLLNLLSKKVISERYIFGLFLFIDILFFTTAYFVSSFVRFQILPATSAFTFVFFSYLSVTILFYYILDLYIVPHQRSMFGFISRASLSNLISSVAVIPVIYFIAGADTLQGSPIGRGILLINFFVFTGGSILYRYFIAKWYKLRAEKINFLLIGKKDLLEEFSKEYEAKKTFFGTAVFVMPNEEMNSSTNLKNAYSWDQLDFLLAKNWSQVVIADNMTLPASISNKLMNKRLQGQVTVDLTDFYEKFWNKIPLFYLKDNWFVHSKGFDLVHSKTKRRLKRFTDLILTFILLIPAIPAMALISFAILLFGGKGPVFFKQKRIGQFGKEFYIYKFRTMVNNAEAIGTHFTHKKDNRITKVGAILRKTRLDELPQVINVLRGEMNFIGFRPEPATIDLDLQERIPYYKFKHILKPGITGWTQIYCENGSTFENSIERLQYDLYYLKNHSVILDVKVVFETIKVMLFGRGSR